MPQITAQETLDTAQATALGSGAMKPEDAGRAWRALQRQAGHEARVKTASPAMLAAVGIGVVHG